MERFAGMVETLTDAPLDAEPERKRRDPRHRVALAVAVLAVVALVAATGWWFVGGARLRPAGGVGYDGVHAVGSPWSFGIELNSSNGPVKLVSATPTSLSGRATVGFAVTTALGSAVGDLAAQGYEPRPMNGTRVDGRGPANTVFLTMTLTAPRAGLIEVHGVDITYRSGPRTRTAHADVDACLFAVTPGSEHRVLTEIDRRQANVSDPSSDDLIARYLRCDGP